MTREIYTPTYISSSTTTTVLGTAGNVFIHTINCPIATTGTVTFEDITGSPVTYFVLPIGSIGCFIIDSIFTNGLKVVTSAADKVLITSSIL